MTPQNFNVNGAHCAQTIISFFSFFVLNCNANKCLSHRVCLKPYYKRLTERIFSSENKKTMDHEFTAAFAYQEHVDSMQRALRLVNEGNDGRSICSSQNSTTSSSPSREHELKMPPSRGAVAYSPCDRGTASIQPMPTSAWQFMPQRTNSPSPSWASSQNTVSSTKSIPTYAQRLVNQLDPTALQIKRSGSVMSNRSGISHRANSVPYGAPNTSQGIPLIYPHHQDHHSLSSRCSTPFATSSYSSGLASTAPNTAMANNPMPTSKKFQRPHHPFLSKERKRKGFGERADDDEFGPRSDMSSNTKLIVGPIVWQPDSVTYDQLFMKERIRTHPDYVYYDIWMHQFEREKEHLRRQHAAGGGPYPPAQYYL